MVKRASNPTEEEDEDLVGGTARGGDGRKTRKNDNQRGGSDAHGVARDQLRSFVERIERLEEEKKTIADDIKDVYSEAKGTGFDTKILRKVIARRKRDAQEIMEEEAILDTYLAALGMIEGPEEY